MVIALVMTPTNFDDIDDTIHTWNEVRGKPLYDYVQGWDKPHYPVPTCIGEVIHLSDDCCYEVIIEDCDEANDPRLHIVVSKLSGRVFDDYPHDSPNYR